MIGGGEEDGKSGSSAAAGSPRVPGFLQRAGTAFLSMGGQAASAFVLTIVVSRAVDPSVRGQFVLLTLMPQIGAYVATLGLPGAVMRAAAATPQRRSALLGASAIASAFAAVVLTALTPLVMSLANSPTPSIALVFGETGAIVLLIFLSWFAYGCERFVLAGALRMVPILAAALAIAGLDLAGHTGLTTMFAPWAGFHILMALLGGIYLVRRDGIVWPHLQEAREWVGYGLRYSTIQLLNLITLRFDQLILGWLGTTAAVGVYSIAASLSEGILLATAAIGLIVFLDSAKEGVGNPFRRKLVLTLLASCAAAALLALVAGPLVELLFGERYASAAALTRILSIGVPGLVALRLITNRLAGANQPGVASIYAVVTLVATTGLDLALIPSHGATGAAWASAVGYNLGGATALLTMRWAIRRGRPGLDSAAEGGLQGSRA